MVSVTEKIDLLRVVLDTRSNSSLCVKSVCILLKDLADEHVYKDELILRQIIVCFTGIGMLRNKNNPISAILNYFILRFLEYHLSGEIRHYRGETSACTHNSTYGKTLEEIIENAHMLNQELYTISGNYFTYPSYSLKCENALKAHQAMIHTIKGLFRYENISNYKTAIIMWIIYYNEDRNQDNIKSHMNDLVAATPARLQLRVNELEVYVRYYESFLLVLDSMDKLQIK